MLRSVASAVTMALCLVAFARRSSAQTLHTNDHWKECALVLDPGLTREAWRQFVSELGLVTYFRPLASAEPMGRRKFEIALVNAGTRIDPSDAAWNDTFSHPDSTHWLFEGDALYIPGLTARAGITDRLDVGAYYTRAIGANYGFVGGQLQYNLSNDSRRHLATAARVSAVRLFGPDDVEATTYGLDLLVSREFSRFSPYAGVSGYMAHARETTPKVDLEPERAFGVQAMVGMAVRVSVLRLGAELNVAKVPGVSFKVGFGS